MVWAPSGEEEQALCTETRLSLFDLLPNQIGAQGTVSLFENYVAVCVRVSYAYVCVFM